MKIIITGATGMIGKGVLLECLDHSAISEVLVIGRNPVGMRHAKLKEILHTNFEDFKEIKDQLKGYDACYFCLGISAVGLTEEKYTRITYGYTLALAKILFDINPGMTFNYVSGMGTDTSGKSRAMWANVKGKTENDLLKLGFKQAFMFRPGAIIPLRGIKSRTKMYQFIYDYFMWLLRIVKALTPYSICNTTQIGLAMINVTRFGYKKNIINPRDIIALAGK